MPNRNYIPVSEGKQIFWLDNFKAKAVIHKLELNISDAELAEINSKVEEFKNSVYSVSEMKAVLKQKETEKHLTKKHLLKMVRKKVARCKTEPTYTSAIGNDLGVVTVQHIVDPHTYKTKLKTKIFPSYIEISFVKKGVDGVNIYYRLKGESKWGFLARSTKSPYCDSKELKTPGIPEVREYMAIGVISDKEIGLESGIVTEVYDGVN